MRRPALSRPKLPPPPASFREWCAALRRRHWRCLVAHPHHYSVAASLTVFSVVIGHYEQTAIVLAWSYAVFENLATAAEGFLPADIVKEITDDITPRV